MLDAVTRLIDRLLVGLLILDVRRRWPLLRLVPSPWLRPLLAPAARRLRRSLDPGVVGLVLVLAAAALLVKYTRLPKRWSRMPFRPLGLGPVAKAVHWRVAARARIGHRGRPTAQITALADHRVLTDQHNRLKGVQPDRIR